MSATLSSTSPSFYDTCMKALPMRQRILSSSWEAIGTQKLIKDLQGIIGEESHKHLNVNAEPAKHMVEMTEACEGDQSRLAYYLKFIHPEFVRFFITGELTVKSFDPNFMRILHQYAQISTTAGVYVNVVCRQEYVSDDSASMASQGFEDRLRGYSVSLSELERVLDAMSKYADIDEDADVCYTIDRAITVDKLGRTGSKRIADRRFLTSDVAASKINTWIKTVRSTVLNPLKIGCQQNNIQDHCHSAFKRSVSVPTLKED